MWSVRRLGVGVVRTDVEVSVQDGRQMTGVVGPALVSSVAGESDEVGSFRVEPRQGRIPMTERGKEPAVYGGRGPAALFVGRNEVHRRGGRDRGVVEHTGQRPSQVVLRVLSGELGSVGT